MNFSELRFWEFLAEGAAVIFVLRALFRNPPEWFD